MSAAWSVLSALSLVWLAAVVGCVIGVAFAVLWAGVRDGWRMAERAWWRWYEPRSARWNRKAEWQIEWRMMETEDECPSEPARRAA